jgi:formate-dependent nitrite reductase membrane component NrfD
LEVILNRFKNNTIFISWSIVAFACILLVSGLFLYLQFRMNKKGSNLKKYFHL